MLKYPERKKKDLMCSRAFSQLFINFTVITGQFVSK